MSAALVIVKHVEDFDRLAAAGTQPAANVFTRCSYWIRFALAVFGVIYMFCRLLVAT